VSIQQEVPPIKLLLISFSTIVVPGNVGSKHRVPESQYLGRGDPAFKDYYPAWLDNMADDATLEGSMLDGVVQGAEAVRSVVVTIRSLYDRQQHKFAGPYGDNGFLEDYVAEVRGELRLCRPGHPQRRRADPARRGELPATQLAAALFPSAGREVRRHPHCRALRRQRVLKRNRLTIPITHTTCFAELGAKL
jgi:hypothetical protein